MGTEQEIARRVRAARPSVHSSPPPFAAVYARVDRVEHAPPRLRAPRRLAVLALLGALTIAACAWGASQLLTGSIVVTGFPPASPNTGDGAPLPSNDAVLGLRVRDPIGGLPWGMRIVRTTRGQACLQVGRVYEGKLGVIGTGYAFGADGRFHTLSPEDALSINCVQVDPRGQFVDVQGPLTVSADGLSLSETRTDRVHCDMPGQHDWGVRCPSSQLRLMAFGALGPDAASLRVRFQGRSFNLRPYGPDGVYLVVFKAPAGTNSGPYFGRQAPSPPAMTVTFRNGSTCTLPSMSDPLRCRPEGIDYSSGPTVTTGDVASPIHASYATNVRGGQSPFVVTGPGSAASAPLRPRPGPGLVVMFEAREGIRGPLATYGVEIHRPVVPECFGGGALLTNQTSPTLAAGQTTRFIIRLQAACHGLYRGRVFYLQISPSSEPAAEERLLNEISASLVKSSLHLPPPGLTVGYFTVEIPDTGAHDEPTEVSPALRSLPADH
jgi:hypothetical protein